MTVGKVPRHRLDTGPDHGHPSAMWRIVYVALLAALLVIPVLLRGHPPLLDYPNHLARMVIALEPDEVLLGFYDFSWRNMSNIGLETVMAGLAAVLPVTIAMEIFVALVLVLTLGGAVALHAALFGQVSVVAGFAAFFVWGGALQFGFLSFCLGVALALWGLAGWIALAPRRVWQLVFGTLAAVVLFYVHLLALGAYALLVAGLEIHRLIARPDGTGGIPERLGHGMVSAAQFLPAGGLVLVTRGGGGQAELHFLGLRAKILFLQRLFWDEGILLSGLMLALVAAVAAISLWHRRLPVDPRMLPGLVLLAMAFVLLPAGITFGDTPNWALDWRFLTPLALAGTAALRTPPLTGRAAALLGAAAVALLAGRTAVMATGSWSAAATQEADLRTCFARLPEGARLLSLPLPMARDVYAWTEGPPPVVHLPAFAVIDRSAYIPSLFAYDDQQPLRYRPEVQALRRGLEGMHFADPARVDWSLAARYDYLLILARPGMDAGALAADLPLALGAPLCDRGWFALVPITQ